MHKLRPDLTSALSAMLDKIDEFIRSGGYSGDPIRMFLAGGMAQHFHCGSRYSEAVDASFSARLLLPAIDLTVDYVCEDGTHFVLYFDANYNDTFALTHPDYRADAIEWLGIGNEKRLVHLFVLTPVDLAVSKISRFSPDDRSDILLLASSGLITGPSLRERAIQALDYYVGNTSWVRATIDQVCAEIG